MSSELITHLLIDVVITFVILYYIKKHIRETQKYHDEIRIEWEGRKENDKLLKQKIDDCLLLCKVNKSCFIGIGGGGSNVLYDISKFDNRHNFIHVDSDLQALSAKILKNKIQLGSQRKAGLGCGGDDQCGKSLVDYKIKKHLYKLTKDEKTIYIVSTLGGGVGSGATPEIVKYLRTLGKEVLVFVTMPFTFEGNVRTSAATNALHSIESITQDVVILKNDDLLDKNKSIGVKETFKITSKIIYKKIADGN